MKAIQVTVDEPLLRELNRRLKGRPRARSEFIREAVRRELVRVRERELDEQERRGYEKHPVKPGEFDWLRQGQVWPGVAK